jgi:hypothetical protein
MNRAFPIIGSTLLTVSSLAFANGPTGSASSAAAAGTHIESAAGSRSTRGTDATAAAPAQKMAANDNLPAVRAAAVSQMTIDGRAVTVMRLEPHAPLTADEERKLKRFGYERYFDKSWDATQPILYCRRVSPSVARNCFSFQVPNKAATEKRETAREMSPSASSAETGPGAGDEPGSSENP